MLTFNKKYFAGMALIFVIEVLIALYIDDGFIRPYFGDVLVVVLIYCFLKSFVKLPVVTAALLVLVFAFTIEFLQLMDIVGKLGLENSKIATTVIGTSFAAIDLWMYAIGIAGVIVFEKSRLHS